MDSAAGCGPIRSRSVATAAWKAAFPVEARRAGEVPENESGEVACRRTFGAGLNPSAGYGIISVFSRKGR